MEVPFKSYDLNHVRPSQDDDDTLNNFKMPLRVMVLTMYRGIGIRQPFQSIPRIERINIQSVQALCLTTHNGRHCT